MAHFFAMGGYAVFVWSVFGLALLVLAFNVIAARRRLRTAVERATKRLARESRRRVNS